MSSCGSLALHSAGLRTFLPARLAHLQVVSDTNPVHVGVGSLEAQKGVDNVLGVAILPDGRVGTSLSRLVLR